MYNVYIYTHTGTGSPSVSLYTDRYTHKISEILYEHSQKRPTVVSKETYYTHTQGLDRLRSVSAQALLCLQA